MTCLCPTCGQRVHPRQMPAKVDLTSNTISTWYGAVTVTPTQAELAAALIRHMPNSVSTPALYSAVWGDDVRFYPGDGKLTPHIRRLRKRLENLGIRLNTVWGFGYRMVIDRAVGAAE